IITGVGTTFIRLHKTLFCKYIISPPKGGGFHPSQNYKLKKQMTGTRQTIAFVISNLTGKVL
ncbi:MAG: hypothetical protein LBV72_05355, partial [Tannerella sp.]|nr:hypothetical protein [Tannerella sp.]